MSGFIYAITAGTAVKIGWSTSPTRRMNKLASDCPLECQLVGVIPGTLAEERGLHRRFAELRVRREWYRNEGEVAAYVATMPAPVLGVRRGRPGNIIRQRRKAAGLTTAAFGKIIGVTQAQVSRMERRGIHRVHRLPRIADALGMTINDLFDGLTKKDETGHIIGWQ